MKTLHPTLDQIINNYRTHGEYTITLKNGQVIYGNFPIPSIEEFSKIIGWDIILSEKTSPTPVYLDQIDGLRMH